MKKPIIGITASPAETPLGKTSVNNTYLLSVLNAGGIPVVLPPVGGKQAAAAMSLGLDGLLVTGGDDLQPQLYGEEPGWGQGSFSPERDELDLTCTQTVHGLGKPILGICRGIQSINVCFGGSLYQDLKCEPFCTVKHVQTGEGRFSSHSVAISEKSVLFPLLGEVAQVNSFHHQSVKRVAEGFRVSATAPDGVVEAIESENGPMILGIQWHPEVMASHGDKVMKKIFDLFIAECAKGMLS